MELMEEPTLVYDPINHSVPDVESTHYAYRPDLALNIFHLHPDPKECAISHVDTHLGKMLVECCQMMSTAVRHVATYQEPELNLDSFYLPTHVNHPMNIWVRSSYDNWYWTMLLALELSREYTYRMFKIHAAHPNCLNALMDDDVNLFMYRHLPHGATAFPLCMPDHYKFYNDPYWCYRTYYKFGKSNLHAWTRRIRPEWLDVIPSYEEIFYE